MYVSLQTAKNAAEIIALIILAWGYLSKMVHFIDKQKKLEEEIKSIKEEQTVLTYGVLACLKGLKEQGCNGPVTEAINSIEKHLNLEAHK